LFDDKVSQCNRNVCGMHAIASSCSLIPVLWQRTSALRSTTVNAV